MKVLLPMITIAGIALSVPAQASNLNAVAPVSDEQSSVYILPVNLDQVLIKSALTTTPAMQVVAFMLEDPSMAAPMPEKLTQVHIAIDPTPVAIKGPPSPGRVEPISDSSVDELPMDLSNNKVIDEMWHLIDHQSFANHHRAH